MVKKVDKSFHKFLLLWSGQFVSSIGSGLTSFGLGVHIFQQTESATAMALVTLLAFLPTFLLSPVAGVLADRYDRRLLMILGDGLSVTGLLFILICMRNDQAQLWQICVGVTISAIFSSLLEPSYKATVTDLLTSAQYTRASGLVGIAESAKYLISPILAGFLLAVTEIKVLLMIDICTFFVTVLATLVVKRGIKVRRKEKVSFSKELKDGWAAVSKNKGVLTLVMMGAVITLLIGVIQTLFAPLFLAFADSITLGVGETVSASGMLVSGIVIGSISVKKGYAKMLCVSLFFAGVFMVLFGLKESTVLICIGGFLFFATLPFTNAALDYMLRTNIDNELQGRAWGFVGIISQLGYVFAYGFSGVFADWIGGVLGIGVGCGAAILIMIAGVLLSGTAIVLYKIKSVRALEKGVYYEF